MLHLKFYVSIDICIIYLTIFLWIFRAYFDAFFLMRAWDGAGALEMFL